MRDEQIVLMYLERSDEAIERTAEKYSAYLTAIARNLLSSREDAEECLNDTYLRAWSSIPPHRPENLGTYLGRIIRNLAINRIAQRTAQKRGGGQADIILSELEECVGSGGSVESAAENAELSAALNRFVKGLGREQRVLFLRRYWYADSLADAAAFCRMSESRAKSMLFRLRKRLRQFLEKEGIEI